MSEKPESVERLVRRHRRLALDANSLIYLLEATDARAEVVAQLIDACDARTIEGYISTIALTEVLTGPARSDDGIAFEQFAAALRDLPVTWVAPDSDIAVDAAWYRGRTHATLPDALHVATARSAGATAFITNDRGIRGTSRLEVVYLDDLVGG